MIKVENLDVKIKTNKILKKINLEIHEGERVVIIGPSGCGKSTLLRCLNGLQKPYKGKVLFKGQDLNGEDVDICKLREKIGMIFQQFNLFPNLTVLNNIMLAPVKLDIMTEANAKKEAIKLLNKVDLKEKIDAYPDNLSGGQRQRVAIARSLIMKPEIILADEPTSALDPEMVGDVINILKKIGEKGETMVVVTHEMKFIEEFATRVIFMEDGKIIEEGATNEILHNPKSDRLKEFLIKIND